MVIFITGITSGFGKAMAEKFSKEGHTVYGTHRSAVEFIGGVRYLKVEVTDSDQVKAAVEQVVAEQGRIDVFISNAGMGVGGPIEFTSLEDARRQMDVNFMGMVNFLKYVVPVMRGQGCGRILCFSSIAGRIGIPFQGFYSASKFAIEGYCQALRLELRKSGISVVVIEPGDFHTGFTASRCKVDDGKALEAYPSYAASMAGMEKDERTGLEPEYLAERVARIVKKKNPAYRYVIATFVQKLSIPLSVILPSRLWARIFAGWYGLS